VQVFKGLMRRNEPGKFAFYPISICVLNSAWFSSAFFDRMKDAETDSITQKSGLGLAFKANLKRPAGSPDDSFPQIANRGLIAPRLKFQKKVILSLLRSFNFNNGYHRVPVLVSHCAIDGAKDFDSADFHRTQIAGVDFENAV
jgi:hypothetical protein